MSNLLSQIKKIRDSFKVDKKQALESKDFDSLKNAYIGRKGKIASLFKELSKVPNESKKSIGESINTLKNAISKEIESLLADKKSPSNKTTLNQ